MSGIFYLPDIHVALKYYTSKHYTEHYTSKQCTRVCSYSSIHLFILCLLYNLVIILNIGDTELHKAIFSTSKQLKIHLEICQLSFCNNRFK